MQCSLAAKAAVTVGPNPAADQGRDSFKVFSAVAMILEFGFAAVLTAGLVNPLLDPRLTGIVGRAAVPRRDHVIIVGLGQVGLRLAMLLRDLGVPVVVWSATRRPRTSPGRRTTGCPW